MDDWRAWLDWLAPLGSTVGFILGFGAQIRLHWKNRSTKGLHTLMVHTLPIGLGLWTLWGLAYGLWPPLVTNGLGLILSLIILWQYHKLPREETKKNPHD